jgi:hypothetical protein
MVKYADYSGLITSLPTVEEVLDTHAAQLGHDLTAHRRWSPRSSDVHDSTAPDDDFDARAAPRERAKP